MTGSDVARRVLDSVRPRVAETVRLDVADVCRLPYDDGAFDLVVCFNVIEHLEDPGRRDDELVRVLATEGLAARIDAESRRRTHSDEPASPSWVLARGAP